MITQNLANSANVKEKNSLDELDKIVIPKDILPEERMVQSEQLNVLFKLVKPKKGRTYLDNCCDNVINPKTKRPERIWLLNGANSIWDTELEYILKDKDRYGRARRGMDIVFIDGVCRVRSSELLKLEFMRANCHNVGDKRGGNGKWDFYEYSPQRESEERQKKQMLKVQMVVKASELDYSASGYGRKLASFLAISMVDELGMAKEPDGIKTELMIKADTDPVTFQKYLDSREVEISYLVKRAIIDAKIDLGGQARNASWANGKGFIAKMPAERKPYEYLTELALTNSDEGRRFLEQLKQVTV